MQDNSDLARFLARNKNLASFLASVACKIFTIFLQDMQENGHFAWTSCKISKKYRKVRPRLWDLACMILARIVDELARWFDLGMEWRKDEVAGTSYGLSEKGWVDSKLFKGWLSEHFLANAVGVRPILLLLDGHSSHYQPELVSFAREYGIILFCL